MKTLAALRLADPPFCANLWQIREGNGFAVVGYPGAPHHEVMNERATAHSLRLYLGFRLSQVAFDSDRLQREGWPTHTLVYRPPGSDFLHDCEHASAFVELRMTDRALRTLAGPKASLTMMPSRPLVSPALGSTIHDLHSCLYGASRDDAMALEEAAMNFAAQAATLLDRNGASSATLPGRLSTQQLHRAIEFIEANLSHQISLADIAAHTQLSIFYFAKAFRAGTGSRRIST
ncbi:MAG: hypothetical protein ACI8W7_001624 [Gammaproteobacteria bacterium]|jgi:hypothetical protein